MTDEELGARICADIPELDFIKWIDGLYERLARAAREALARPVMMIEGMTQDQLIEAMQPRMGPMSDYARLVESLKADAQDVEWEAKYRYKKGEDAGADVLIERVNIMLQAAAAIEALSAEVERLKAQPCPCGEWTMGGAALAPPDAGYPVRSFPHRLHR